MVFNFPPLVFVVPLGMPPLITPFTSLTGQGMVLLPCKDAHVSMGGRYLLIVAILQDTKLGLVMSAVMSSYQGNRSLPLAWRSDRWDGTDLCELGQDKVASLSSFALSLCEELPAAFTTACPLPRTLHRWQNQSLLSFLLCLLHFYLHLPLTHRF